MLVGRNEERLNAVRDALVARHGVDLYPIVVADMGSLASVRAAADQVLATESRLDVLIDNAGAIFPDRTIGPDGIEATLATLVVGPFTLIRGLLPLLDRTGGSRVIAVTSGGQYAQGLDLDDLQYSRGVYDGTRAYARAKRAQVSLIREWARRFGGAGIQFDSMHPGWARTPGLVEALPLFARLMGPLLRTPAEGIDTLVWLATATADETDGTRRIPVARPPHAPVRPAANDTSVAPRSPSPLGSRRRPCRRRGSPTHQSPNLLEPPMTTLHEQVETTLPIDDVFDYVADFANSQEWDPGVATAERLDEGPVGLGSRFRLGVRLGPRVGTMDYRISVFEPPTRVVLVGSGSGVSAVDEIRLERLATGTRLDYTADIRLGGILRLVEPFLGATFANIGRNAADGMQRTLEAQATAARQGRDHRGHDGRDAA